jgi:hypothetical protein
MRCVRASLVAAIFAAGCPETGEGEAAGGTGSGSTGEPGSGNPTDGMSCEGFEDEAAPVLQPIPVAIVNTGAQPIVLAQHGCSGLYVAVESLVPGIPGGWPDNDCGFTCVDVLAGDCLCGIDCGPSEAIRLEPGGTYTTSWDGSFRRRFSPSAACYAGDTCVSQPCEAIRTAPDGSYVLFSEAAPLDTACPEGCDCEPNADGWCAVPPSFGASIMQSVEITLPIDSATIEF